MRIYGDEDRFDLPGAVVALGTFDGVHLGHQAVLETALSLGRSLGLPAVAFTYWSHPLKTLDPCRAPQQITLAGEKAALLFRLGLDAVVLRSFTPAFASQDAACFLRQLTGRYRARAIVAGRNHRFGAGGKGGAELLLACQRLGYRAAVVPPLRLSGETVSSTAIRKALSQGDVRRAYALMGHSYTLSGRIVHGRALGRTLGFPTINIELPEGKLLPARGVYAGYATVEGMRYRAALNLGVKPTVGGGALSLEANLLDFEGTLYGEDAKLSFVAYLRPERRFESKEALAAQIGRDVERARACLLGMS